MGVVCWAVGWNLALAVGYWLELVWCKNLALGAGWNLTLAARICLVGWIILCSCFCCNFVWKHVFWNMRLCMVVMILWNWLYGLLLFQLGQPIIWAWAGNVGLTIFDVTLLS